VAVLSVIYQSQVFHQVCFLLFFRSLPQEAYN